MGLIKIGTAIGSLEFPSEKYPLSGQSVTVSRGGVSCGSINAYDADASAMLGFSGRQPKSATAIKSRQVSISWKISRGIGWPDAAASEDLEAVRLERAASNESHLRYPLRDDVDEV